MIPGMRGFRRMVRKEVESVADDVEAKASMKARADPRMLARWMSYTGADSPEGIDYADPCVEIEFWACDPSLHALAARDGEKFLERTGCDRETFMAYYDQSSEAP